MSDDLPPLPLEALEALEAIDRGEPGADAVSLAWARALRSVGWAIESGGRIILTAAGRRARDEMAAQHRFQGKAGRA